MCLAAPDHIDRLAAVRVVGLNRAAALGGERVTDARGQAARSDGILHLAPRAHTLREATTAVPIALEVARLDLRALVARAFVRRLTSAAVRNRVSPPVLDALRKLVEGPVFTALRAPPTGYW